LIVQSYEGKLNLLTNQTTAFGLYSVLNGWLVTDCSVENVNPHVTPNRMLLYVCVSPKKKGKKKKYNKHFILITLCES